MPDFDAPTDSELRILWRDYTDPQVRLLILEILALRKSIERVQAWFDYVDKHIDNKGDLGGGQGPASAPAASAQGREATRDDALARLTQFDGLLGPRQWTALAEVVNSYENHTYERTHARYMICVGDTTTHGGRVLEGTATATIDGNPLPASGTGYFARSAKACFPSCLPRGGATRTKSQAGRQPSRA